MMIVWKDIYCIRCTYILAYTAIYVHCTLWLEQFWVHLSSKSTKLRISFASVQQQEQTGIPCIAQLLKLTLERVIAMFTIPRVTHQGPSVPLNGEVLLQPRSLVLQTIPFGSDLPTWSISKPCTPTLMSSTLQMGNQTHQNVHTVFLQRSNWPDLSFSTLT